MLPAYDESQYASKKKKAYSTNPSFGHAKSGPQGCSRSPEALNDIAEFHSGCYRVGFPSCGKDSERR